MASSNKKPKIKEEPNVSKTPKVARYNIPSKFTWSFLIVDLEGSFGWDKCESKEKLIEVMSKKKGFENMTLTELGYQGSHSVSVTSLSKAAAQRLQEINLDDLDTLFSFRLSGKNRVICIQSNDVMKVLWWDPEHLVCPSEKKHT